jgi:hypothetical protein
MNKSSDIPWKRISAEAVAIVGSILMAFAIDAWWDDRVDEKVAREYVAQLLVETRENLRGLEELVAYHEEVISKSAELIRLVGDGGPGGPHDRVRELVLEIQYFDTYQVATSALDNIIGAGGLGHLQDPQLQLAISKYSQAAQYHNSLQEELADLVVNDFTVFFAERIPYLAIGFADRALSVSAPESAFTFDATVFVGSLQFENMMVRRIVAEDDAANSGRRLIQATEDLIEHLELSD